MNMIQRKRNTWQSRKSIPKIDPPAISDNTLTKEEVKLMLEKYLLNCKTKEDRHDVFKILEETKIKFDN